MGISIFELFSIGIGPSSSHTIGPMRAAKKFASKLNNFANIAIKLYGSLAYTGIGHGTDKALLLGLAGHDPATVLPEQIPDYLQAVDQRNIDITYCKDPQQLLPFHPNALEFTAYDQQHHVIAKDIYYSIGGGFIVDNQDLDTEQHLPAPPTESALPYPFATADELLNYCKKNQLTIEQIMLANEKTYRTEQEIYQQINTIWQVMEQAITRGCERAPGSTIPGGLNLKRRAPSLCEKMQHQHNNKTNWLNVYAIAVNEENASGQRVVTAPTNGAAGIIPAIIKYYRQFYHDHSEQALVKFFLTAGAIGILFKKGASISGAEMGCQGEIGVASSMAAGALAAVLGAGPWTIEKAAEIAIEHHLGLTCDPVAGLVQIPCIERNAMGAVKAFNAAQLAINESYEHRVSLDSAIATMRQTGLDMSSKYKETALGGLAVNVPDC